MSNHSLGKAFSFFCIKLRYHGSIAHWEETAGCLSNSSEIVVLSLLPSDSIENNRDAWALCHLQLGDDSTSVTIRTTRGPIRVQDGELQDNIAANETTQGGHSHQSVTLITIVIFEWQTRLFSLAQNIIIPGYYQRMLGANYKSWVRQSSLFAVRHVLVITGWDCHHRIPRHGETEEDRQF